MSDVLLITITYATCGLTCFWLGRYWERFGREKKQRFEKEKPQEGYRIAAPKPADFVEPEPLKFEPACTCVDRFPDPRCPKHPIMKVKLSDLDKLMSDVKTMEKDINRAALKSKVNIETSRTRVSTAFEVREVSIVSGPISGAVGIHTRENGDVWCVSCQEWHNPKFSHE